MSRKVIVATVAAVAAVLGVTGTAIGTTSQADAQPQSAPTTGARPLSPDQRAQALRTAQDEAATTAKALHLGAKEQLRAKDVVIDTNGARNVRYDRTYDNLAVLGGDLIVHRTPDGSIATVDRASGDTITVPSTAPKLSTQQVGDRAAKLTAGRTTGSELVVYAANHKPVLAYRSTVDGTDGREVVISDAASGELLDRYHQEHRATGNGVLDGQVNIDTSQQGGQYVMIDPNRGNTAIYDAHNSPQSSPSSRATLYTDSDNVWGNGSNSDRASAGVDGNYGLAKTWDYYKNTFGRTGIRNDGQGATAYVHTDTNLLNAFYDDSCFCMVFGDGNSSNGNTPVIGIDVTGHEMTHGVTAATANLNYSGESGGLNEATSDIFGTMVEFYANNSRDPGNYYIGEQLNMPSGYFRRMDNPSVDGSSLSCWSSNAGSVDVHYSSGIGNHFFYLAAEGTGAKTIGGKSHNGTTCNNTSFAGIGRDKAAAIYYRALTTYMTSTTNYAAARTATLNAAADLYGSGSTERYLVSVAWAAVNVGTALPPPTTTPTTPPTTTTTSTPPGGNAITNGGFEAGQNGWGGSNVVTNSANSAAHGGSYYAWLLGNGSTATEYITQTVTVPNSGAPKLSFYLAISTQESGSTAYDTLQVQVNGTTLATYSNANVSSGYVLRTVDLSGYRGQNVTLRFYGVEDAYLATNFLLDDVSLS
ncbi:M4 family metallopeptidase [Kutzneria albida]|uniref:Neutral metalloproteinase n=1 Tax=Kutzneria albida DSM 43870 TaxID=1449976 RepID=W5W3U4_9PSEU|nr:M4 family metallopeptidase [Kutzneria albida]AHH95460.1 Bacillolysin [Kutzneria albida DSM 43870]